MDEPGECAGEFSLGIGSYFRGFDEVGDVGFEFTDERFVQIGVEFVRSGH
jgi:hypothetical protein